jgi:hypothetical protein
MRTVSLKIRKQISKKLKGRLSPLKGIKRPNFHPSNYMEIGTKLKTWDGYYQIKINHYKWALEHRLLVENYIGRRLKSSEVIHHIDSNKLNNELKNLYIFTNRILHNAFETLVRYNFIDRNYLKSNLDEFKQIKEE